MHFYGSLDGIRVTFVGFCLLRLTFFDFFWPIFDPMRGHIEPFLGDFRRFWVDTREFLSEESFRFVRNLRAFCPLSKTLPVIFDHLHPIPGCGDGCMPGKSRPRQSNFLLAMARCRIADQNLFFYSAAANALCGTKHIIHQQSSSSSSTSLLLDLLSERPRSMGLKSGT